MTNESLLNYISKFNCPFCGTRLEKEGKGTKSRFECPNSKCPFETPSNKRGEPKVLVDVSDKLKNALGYLRLRHNVKFCKICNGEERAKIFENSLFHQILEKGKITKRQYENIENGINRLSNIDEIDKNYSFPPDQEISGDELYKLRKFGFDESY